jgi:hypothetical protein
LLLNDAKAQEIPLKTALKVCLKLIYSFSRQKPKRQLQKFKLIPSENKEDAIVPIALKNR